MATKDISDAQVCCAVLDYQQAIKPLLPTGMGECFGLKEREEWPLYPYEALAQQTGQSEKVCFRAVERACRRGLIEYGVSLRTGWLTREGLDLVYAHRSALAVSDDAR